MRTRSQTKNSAHIIIIRDRSGSMHSFEDRNPIKRIIETMAPDCPNAIVSVYSFNESVCDVIEEMPIKDVLSADNLKRIYDATEPDGLTALFKSVLRTKKLVLRKKDQMIVISDGRNNVAPELKTECMEYISSLKGRGIDVEFVGVNGLDIKESCQAYGLEKIVLQRELKRGEVFQGLVMLGKAASQRSQGVSVM